MKKKILIVEDDKDFVLILRTKFESEGFSVTTAPNGQEGIACVQKETPDIILTDVLMIGMDGVEMAKKIRTYDKKVPIVFLTNLKNTENTAEIEDSADFEYLIKSDISISDIVKRIKEKLGLN
jgi:CheY-like chemotaxis protein